MLIKQTKVKLRLYLEELFRNYKSVQVIELQIGAKWYYTSKQVHGLEIGGEALQNRAMITNWSINYK